MEKGKATQAIHGKRDETYRSAVYPIYQTSTFGVEKSEDYVTEREDEDFYLYTRLHNPTVRNIEERLARLENAEDCVFFSSGMAAVTSTILSLVQGGDTIASSRPVYSGSYDFMANVLPKYGVKTVFLEGDAIYEVDKHVPDAKIVYIESPANPTCKCVNITKVVAAAKRIGAVTLIDSTFASPLNQNPIDLGIDIVIHSATKYLAGHGDLVAGAAVASKALTEGIRHNMKTFGGCLSPLEAFLIERSLKTLKVRVEEHNNNAMALARFFSHQSKVKRVYYPGLPDSPDYDVAVQQMHGFGGMLAIELESLDAAKIFCDSLELALNAVSLGDVETLMTIPVISTHADVDEEELRISRVTPGLIRVSVGLEDIVDLIADCQQALDKIG